MIQHVKKAKNAIIVLFALFFCAGAYGREENPEKQLAKKLQYYFKFDYNLAASLFDDETLRNTKFEFYTASFFDDGTFQSTNYRGTGKYEKTPNSLDYAGESWRLFDDFGYIDSGWEIFNYHKVNSRIQITNFETNVKNIAKSKIQNINETCLIIIRPEFNYDPEEGDDGDIGVDWDAYAFGTSERYKKMGIETVYAKKQYLSFALSSHPAEDKNFVIDTKKEQNGKTPPGALLYKSGYIPTMIDIVGGSEREDALVQMYLHEVIAKPLETSQPSVAAAEKWGSGARVPGKFGGFAISSHDKPGYDSPGMTLIQDTDFEIEDGVLTNYKGGGGFVLIPDGVTSIGFKTRRITKGGRLFVVIPDGVTSIGPRAFFDNQITGVRIPDSVTSIGEDAFLGANLESVTIPNSVKTIGDDALGYDRAGRFHTPVEGFIIYGAPGSAAEDYAKKHTFIKFISADPKKLDVLARPDEVIVKKIFGDLNNDKIDDCVMITKETKAEAFGAHLDSDEIEIVDCNRRGLLIAFKEGASYKKVLELPACFSSENGVSFPKKLSVEIKGGNLIVRYDEHPEYRPGCWSQFVFRYRNNNFELIGFDETNYYKGALDSKVSINYLTKKKQTFDTESGSLKETWTDINLVGNLLKLAYISDFDYINVGAAYFNEANPEVYSNKMANQNWDDLYDKYIPLKTTDMNGKPKTPAQALSYLKLNNNNTYELVFLNEKKSTGGMKLYYEYEDELDTRKWQLQLRDSRNDDEPSYNFILGMEDDGSIRVIEIPQGVGDNSWLRTADVWFLVKDFKEKEDPQRKVKHSWMRTNGNSYPMFFDDGTKDMSWIKDRRIDGDYFALFFDDGRARLTDEFTKNMENLPPNDTNDTFDDYYPDNLRVKVNSDQEFIMKFFDSSGGILPGWTIINYYTIRSQLQITDLIPDSDLSKENLSQYDNSELIEDTCLIIPLPLPQQHFVDDDSAEAQEYNAAIAYEWMSYKYDTRATRARFEKMGIKTIYPEDRKFLSFWLSDNESVAVNTQREQNGKKVDALLYRKGYIPIRIDFIGDEREDMLAKYYLHGESGDGSPPQVRYARTGEKSGGESK